MIEINKQFIDDVSENAGKLTHALKKELNVTTHLGAEGRVATETYERVKCPSIKYYHDNVSNDKFKKSNYVKIKDTIDTCVIPKILKSKYNIMANKFGLAIAGGYLVGMLKSGKMYPDSDVDFFFIGNECITKEYIKEIVDYIKVSFTGCDSNIYITRNAVTVTGAGIKIQIVLKQYNNIENLVKSFDIDCCKIVLYNNVLSCAEEAKRSLTYNVNIIRSDCTWTSLTSKRYVKYFNRLFDICIAGEQSDEYFKHRIETAIKEKSISSMANSERFCYFSKKTFLYGVTELLCRMLNVQCNLYKLQPGELENMENFNVLTSFYSTKDTFIKNGTSATLPDYWERTPVVVQNYTAPYTTSIDVLFNFFE